MHSLSSHLHHLLSLPLVAPRLGRLRMLTRPSANGGREPAWAVAPGDSTESLALHVATAARVPMGVVARAAELYEVGGKGGGKWGGGEPGEYVTS